MSEVTIGVKFGYIFSPANTEINVLFPESTSPATAIWT